MAQALKILHILSTPRAEGTPNLVVDWLATELHEQEVFVLNSQPADLTDRLRAARWYDQKNYFSHGRSKFTKIAAGVRNVCLQRRPDVLICWPTGFSNWVCLGAHLAGVKRLLVHCGNPPNRSVKGDWISRYGLWPLALLDAKCVCCSDYVRKEYQAVPWIPDKIFHTVWNCARIEEVCRRSFSARTRREPDEHFPTAIMVATLERHKDHATLLRAVPLIRKRLPGFVLRLVGDGSLRSELQRLAAALGIDKAVEFLGTRGDVPELLGIADLFVLSTTLQEGLGTVLIEALAAGLPVIASDVPACRELLANGQFGKLVPAGDIDLLAQAVIDTLDSLPLGDSSARKRHLGQFSTRRMMGRYLVLAGYSPASAEGDS